ncbi:MAG: DUF3347 domain-containing protein [Calditrichia bacterium]
MKHFFILTAMFGFMLAFSAQAGSVADFRNQLSQTTEAYLQIKNALVNDNAEKASENASEFLKSLKNVDAGQLAEGTKEEWQEKASIMTEQARQIKSAESLAEQRKAFGKLSEAVGFAAKKYGPLNTTLYRQYCPMAFNNEGGQWLSTSEEIRNPYFGSKMMKCGKVLEEFTSYNDK